MMQNAPQTPDRKRILIVDADEQVTAVLALKLRQAGYEVLNLPSTVNALAAIREFLPHLIISEMVLPELSGVDFLKRIKMNPETAHIPFIFLSSSRNVEDKIIAHEMGAEAFFAKPIFIKVLLNRISDFFQERDFKEILVSSGEQEEFTGLLQNISILDLLNIVHENRRSGKITLTSGGETGHIYFADGALIRIDKEGAESKSGEDILYTFLPWMEGSFRIVYGDQPVEQNLTEPFDRLIVNAMNWFSEYQSEISEMPALDVIVHLQLPAFIEQLAKLPDTIGILLKEVPEEGIRVGELIEKAGSDRKRAIEYLKKLVALGILGYEPCTTSFQPNAVPAWVHPDSSTGESKPRDKRPAATVAPSPTLPGDAADIKRATVAPAPVTILQPPPPPIPTPAPAPAPQHRDTVKLDDDEERRALIESLENEPGTASHGHGRTLMVFAILVSLAATGIALWYFFFRPANAPLPLEPVVETVAAPEPPPPPPPPAKPKDPYEGKKAEELLAMATAAHGAEKYADAITLYRAALEKVPAGDTAALLISKIWKNLAIAQYDAEDYPAALDAIEQSLLGGIEPEKIELKAAILEEMKRFDDAMNTYRAFLKNKEYKPKVTYWINEIMRLKKEKKKAGATK
ncbi:MAG TPA: response regulator [bacterium]|nr:response regulator [bacterium]